MLDSIDLYILLHRNIINGVASDIKYIGVFDDYANVQNAIGELIEQPGFSSYPEIVSEDSFCDDGRLSGFMIKKYEVDKDYTDQTLVQNW